MLQCFSSVRVGRLFSGVTTGAILVIASMTYASSAAAAFCDIESSAPHVPPIRTPNGAAPAPHAPPIRQVDHVCQAMSHLGCKSLLGKKDEWICKTPAALLTCEAFKKQGKLKACPDPNKQNLEQLAEQAMEALGCKNLLGKVGEPLCSKEEGIAACNALHAAGYLKKCHP